jgi:hypothetical protein
MKRIKYQYLIIISACILSTACADYLDVVPEGTSSLENAFSTRTTVLRYLAGCYSYLPSHEDGHALDITGGDEVWIHSAAVTSVQSINVARGLQTAQSPLCNLWPDMYKALRDCNVFLENIVNMPPLKEFPELERRQWMAEAKILKAYYHFLLLRQYGPVPIVRGSLPVSAGVDEVRVSRDKVDDVVNYAVELIDEAMPDLPDEIYNISEELGRITKPIAQTIKANILVTAASPLFNGNTMHATLTNSKGESLINTTFSVEKWEKAVAACEQAIKTCDSLGLKLYEYPGDRQFNFTDTIMTQLSLRGAFTERWNDELIWGDTKASVGSGLQVLATPRLNPAWQDYGYVMKHYFGSPLKIAEMFYTDNGVPINEDKTWDYNSRYDLRVSVTDERLYIREGTATVRLHYNREPRFYAAMGFDNGVWYGWGVYDDSNPSALYYVQAKGGQINTSTATGGIMTGYYIKKWMHPQSYQNAALSFTTVWYVWPLYRLADLYLLYAEALNEAADNAGNRELAMEYLNLVRARAGLKTVQESWANYSIYSDKYTRQDGLREIIRQERLIELCYERKRFWDLRRWMTADEVYRTPIQGWDFTKSDPVLYYIPQTFFEQVFNFRDYLWPVPSNEITGNPNLVQNIGW